MNGMLAMAAPWYAMTTDAAWNAAAAERKLRPSRCSTCAWRQNNA
jgi:hypothetical protein